MPAVGVRVQMFVATAEEWARPHEILEENWVGIESDTGLMKLGDGFSRWLDLAYINLGEAGGSEGFVVKDEGVTVGGAGSVGTMDFTGTGVTATLNGNVLTVDVPGAAEDTLIIKNDGVTVAGAGTIESIDFTGAGVTATLLGNEVTVNVPNTGGDGGSSYDFGDVGNLKLWETDHDHFFPSSTHGIVSISNLDTSSSSPGSFIPTSPWAILELGAEVNQASGYIGYGIFNFMQISGSYTGGTTYGIYQRLETRNNSGGDATHHLVGINTDLISESGAGRLTGISLSCTKGNANSVAYMTGLKTLLLHGYNTLTEGTGVDVELRTGSTGGTIQLARGLRVWVNSQGVTPHTFTDIRGISLDGWADGIGSTYTTSYGIYADSTIDKGSNRYFIYSLSTSPSVFSGDIRVPDEAYGVAWNGSLEVPTKNAIYDKIETLSAAGMTVGAAITGGTNNTILYKDASGNLDSNTTLNWNESRMGIIVTSPTATLDILSVAGDPTLKLTGTVPGTVASGNGTNAGAMFTMTGVNGGDNTGTTTNSSAGTGSTFVLVGGNGGEHSGIPGAGYTRGGAGGSVSITSGNGGDGLAANNDGRGGLGGDVTITTGAGGNSVSTSGSGGVGGAFTITCGPGGSSAFSPAQGGSISFTSGAGGSSAGAGVNGGIGGDVTFLSGVGAANHQSGAAGGAGGAITMLARDGGANNIAGGTTGDGGSVSMDAGAAGTTSGGATLGANGSISIGTTNALNLNLGRSASKIGFFGATAVVKPAGTGETVGFTAGGGTTVTDSSTFTGNVGSTAYRISDIVKALKNLGLLTS